MSPYDIEFYVIETTRVKKPPTVVFFTTVEMMGGFLLKGGLLSDSITLNVVPFDVSHFF